MTYKAQYLVPIQVEFEAMSDADAERIADTMSLAKIVKYGDPSYPDLGFHALIDADGRTISEV